MLSLLFVSTANGKTEKHGYLLGCSYCVAKEALAFSVSLLGTTLAGMCPQSSREATAR